MIKALVKNGVVVPCDPLPADWQEGTEVEVERKTRVDKTSPESTETSDDLDRWMAAVQASADQMDVVDEAILERNVREIRRQARDLARKEAEKA